MSEQKQIGNATMTVADDEFANGYQAGYLRYITTYKGHLLTDIEVYSFLARTLSDIDNTDQWNAGYILGWGAALHEPCRKDGNVPKHHFFYEGISILQELDLGHHHLFILSDGSIAMFAHSASTPARGIHLDSEETYRLFISLHHQFQQTAAPPFSCPAHSHHREGQR